MRKNLVCYFAIDLNMFYPSALNRLFSLKYFAQVTGMSAAMTPSSSDLSPHFPIQSYVVFRAFPVGVGRSGALSRL